MVFLAYLSFCLLFDGKDLEGKKKIFKICKRSICIYSFFWRRRFFFLQCISTDIFLHSDPKQQLAFWPAWQGSKRFNSIKTTHFLLWVSENYGGGNVLGRGACSQSFPMRSVSPSHIRLVVSHDKISDVLWYATSVCTKKNRCGPSFFARFALVFSIPFSLWGLQVWSGGLGFIPHVFGGLCFCWKPHPAEFWFLASLKRKKKKRLGASNLSSDVSIIFLPHIWKVPLYFFWPIFWARPVSRESGGGFQGVLRQRPALQFTFISEPRGSNVEV